MVFFSFEHQSSFSSLVSLDDCEKTTSADNSVVRESACPALRFSLDQNVVHTIPNRHELTESERSAAYMSSQELYEMKRFVRQTARWVYFNETNEEESGFSIRGVESAVFPEISNTRRASRRLAAAAVFIEQEAQALDVTANDEIIAQEYLKISGPALIRAQAKARQDAMDADRFMEI